MNQKIIYLTTAISDFGQQTMTISDGLKLLNHPSEKISLGNYRYFLQSKNLSAIEQQISISIGLILGRANKSSALICVYLWTCILRL